MICFNDEKVTIFIITVIIVCLVPKRLRLHIQISNYTLNFDSK